MRKRREEREEGGERGKERGGRNEKRMKKEEREGTSVWLCRGLFSVFLTHWWTLICTCSIGKAQAVTEAERSSHCALLCSSCGHHHLSLSGTLSLMDSYFMCDCGSCMFIVLSWFPPGYVCFDRNSLMSFFHCGARGSFLV